jgi:hypothetical protein
VAAARAAVVAGASVVAPRIAAAQRKDVQCHALQGQLHLVTYVHDCVLYSKFSVCISDCKAHAHFSSIETV